MVCAYEIVVKGSNSGLDLVSYIDADASSNTFKAAVTSRLRQLPGCKLPAIGELTASRVCKELRQRRVKRSRALMLTLLL